MLKSTLRTAGKTARTWLTNKQARDERSTSPHREFNYAWLNRTLFPQIIAERDRTLRENYVWGVLQGANLARALGIKRVSVIEFGVAGGNGLVSLERIAKKIESAVGVGIDVYGFDTGAGLPKPQDYRDLPNIYSEGRHAMDVDKLRSRLTRARLVLGSIENTVPEFMQSGPAPIAFISIDVDLYSSTVHALRVLDADQNLLLPRIHCYLDDIMGLTCGDHNGERLAIAEFNTSHEMRKISPIYGLKYYLPVQYAAKKWTECFFMAHIFNHDRYGCFDGLAPLYDLSLASE